MEAVFLKLLNMSIAASWLVLAVVVLRLVLKKAPKAITVVLWALVGIRLIWPFSIESMLSLIPSAETVPADIGQTPTPAIHSGIPAVNHLVNPMLSQTLSPTPVASVNPMQTVEHVAARVWVAGMIAMAVYMAVSWLAVRRRVREATPGPDGVWLCDHISTPFILGLFRPRIYLPSAMEAQDARYVIAHEQAHLKRRDHWWKPLGFLLLTIHWFNPAMWVAYILLCRDIELACDEKVIRQLGSDSKKPYSDALINCSVPRKMIAACPLAFGENGIKGRIKSILNYKKPAFWIVLVAVIACIAVAVCFLTDPKEPEKTEAPKSPAQSHASLTSPPTLTVSDGNGTAITAWQGGYSWTYEEAGESFHTITDALHPTDAIADMPRIALQPTAYSFQESNQVFLDFGLEPDSITVTYRSEDVLSSAGGTLSAATGSFALVEGEFLYIIQASWAQRGEATYAFVGEFYVPEISNGIDTEASLREQYPQYFDLSTTKGLTVYVWQTVTGEMRCGLQSGRNYTPTKEELPEMGGISFTQMRMILTSYDNYYEMTSVMPVELLRKELTEEDQAYLERIRKIFWSDDPERGCAIEKLRCFTPQYFDLDTSNGLYVFVWNMAPSGYCGLGTSGEYEYAGDWFGYSFGEFSKLRGVDFSQMHLILSTYDIAREDIHLVPFQHPLSSYRWQIDDATQLALEWEFGGVVSPEGRTFPVMETAVFDVDGDGKQEVCALGHGTTSGLFSFTLFVQEPDKGTFDGYAHFVSEWFDLSFQTGDDGITRVQGVTQDEPSETHLFDIVISDGTVLLSENGVPISEVR